MSTPSMKALRASAFVALFVCAAGLTAQDRPYEEGPVTEVAYIRTKPGMFDAYMQWVATERKREMEALKKAGIVVDYRVFVATPRRPDEPNLILTTTYKNMAALDGLNERSDAITRKVFGSLSAANQGTIDRGKMREEIGTEYIRELVLD